MKIKYTGAYSYTVLTSDNKKITFKKGDNQIEDKVWNDLKKNPLINDRLNKGVLLLVVTRTTEDEITETPTISEVKNSDNDEKTIDEDEAKDEDKNNKNEKQNQTADDDSDNSDSDLDNDAENEDEPIDITALKADEAIDAVKLCLNPKTLKKWQKEDKRVTVTNAINTQIEALKEVENV